MATLAEHARAHLVTQGIVRVPAVAAPAAAADAIELPAAWVDPNEGPPAPGEPGPENGPNEPSRDVVVAIENATGLATRPYEGFMRILGLNFRYRARRQDQAQTVHELIAAEILDVRLFDLAGLLCQEIRGFTPWQPAGSDRNAFDSTASYIVWVLDQDYHPELPLP